MKKTTKNYRPIIQQIIKLIRQHKKFLITAHTGADGDAVGSQLALKMMLAKMGKTGHIVNVGGISKELTFLPGFAEINNGIKHLQSSYDAIIVVDSGSFERLEEMRTALRPKRPMINIDHHASNDNFGTLNWVAPEMSSVGEMVYRLLKTARIPIDKDMATNLYVSLATDTGHFSFASTTPASHLMASDLLNHGVNLGEAIKNLYSNKTPGDIKLQYDCLKRIKFAHGNRIVWTVLTRSMYKKHRALPGDPQEYLQILKSIKNVSVAILFRETLTNPLKIKISIRSEPPVDANKLARHFGGGGHYRAAGCRMTGSLKKAQRLLISKAKQYLK